VLQYARQLGVVLWDNAIKRCFFVEAGGHTNLKEFISRRTG
jgi:transcription initiation factor TFIIH subunit 4